jgi:hypothetical protein
VSLQPCGEDSAGEFEVADLRVLVGPLLLCELAQGHRGRRCQRPCLCPRRHGRLEGIVFTAQQEHMLHNPLAGQMVDVHAHEPVDNRWWVLAVNQIHNLIDDFDAVWPPGERGSARSTAESTTPGDGVGLSVIQPGL